MTEFLLAAAGFVLLTVAVGLLRILGGPGNVDRTMAAQQADRHGQQDEACRGEQELSHGRSPG